MTDEEARPAAWEATDGTGVKNQASVPLAGLPHQRPPSGRALYTATDLGAWYWLGVLHERWRIAEVWTELDECWRPIGPQLHADAAAERRRLFERCAHEFAARGGKPYREYHGGPVDWETGRPARRLSVAA